ncbi:MAG: cohesin domain-containing protein, partial [Euryarchaeota archaeon]|nr:cohesin domain-containing protein [Euryarchaeota archaeon]
MSQVVAIVTTTMWMCNITTKGDVTTKTKYLTYCALIVLAIFSASASADLAIVGDANNAEQAQVCVNAPDIASDAFDATIDVCNVTDLDSGQFELTFNSSVVNVTAVGAGDIGGTEVPIDSWNFTDVGMICVLFNLPDVTGVSGSGRIATISFEVMGAPGDTSVLNLSNGVLVDAMSNETSALWCGCEVAIGVAVAVNSPEVTIGAFSATVDVEDVLNMNGGQFDLAFDSSVVNVTNVTSGEIGGTAIPIVGWEFMDADTIRVLFKLSGANGTSGTGSMATIEFARVGSQSDTSVLDVSGGVLSDTEAGEIPATWADAAVAIGVAVEVNAPEVTIGAFTATVDVEDITGMNSGQFDLTFDPGVVNVTNVTSGKIGGTEIPIVDWRFMDADTIRVL